MNRQLFNINDSIFQLLEKMSSCEEDCSTLHDYCNILLERIYLTSPDALEGIMIWLDSILGPPRSPKGHGPPQVIVDGSERVVEC